MISPIFSPFNACFFNFCLAYVHKGLACLIRNRGRKTSHRLALRLIIKCCPPRIAPVGYINWFSGTLHSLWYHTIVLSLFYNLPPPQIPTIGHDAVRTQLHTCFSTYARTHTHKHPLTPTYIFKCTPLILVALNLPHKPTTKHSAFCVVLNDTEYPCTQLRTGV